MADEDDLYSDLYGDEIQVNPSPPPEDEPSTKDEASTSTGLPSFIPGGASYVAPAPKDSNNRLNNQSYNRGSQQQQRASSTSSSSFIPPSTSSRAETSSSSSSYNNNNNQSNDYSNQSHDNNRDRNNGGGDRSNTRNRGSNGPNALFNQGNKFSAGNNDGHRDRNNREPKEIPVESVGLLRPHEMPDDGKIFVGGLDWATTDENLKEYFQQWGKVNHVTIMRDPGAKSRGFAFLCFADPSTVQQVLGKDHYLDGKVIDAKRAIPRPVHAKCSKIFVGGVPNHVTADMFREFFGSYGTVTESTLMMDKDTQRTRGFGFVTFAEEDAAENLIAQQPLDMEGKSVEIKHAAPKSERDPTATPGSTIFQRGGGSGGTRSGQTYDSRTGDADDNRSSNSNQRGNNNRNHNTMDMNQMGGGMGMMGMGGMGGMGMMGNQFDPQAMARMFQQTGWGSQQWNPQMLWQMNQMGMNGMGMNGMGMNGMGMGGMGGMNHQGMMGMGGGYGNQMGGYGGQQMGGMNMGMGGMNQGGMGSMSPPQHHQQQQQPIQPQPQPPQMQQQQQLPSGTTNTNNAGGRKRIDYSNLDNYQIKTENKNDQTSTPPSGSRGPNGLPPRPTGNLPGNGRAPPPAHFNKKEDDDTVIDVMSRGRSSLSRSKSPETARRLAGRDRERSPNAVKREDDGGRADRN